MKFGLIIHHDPFFHHQERAGHGNVTHFLHQRGWGLKA